MQKGTVGNGEARPSTLAVEDCTASVEGLVVAEGAAGNSKKRGVDRSAVIVCGSVVFEGAVVDLQGRTAGFDCAASVGGSVVGEDDVIERSRGVRNQSAA